MCRCGCVSFCLFCPPPRLSHSHAHLIFTVPLLWPASSSRCTSRCRQFSTRPTIFVPYMSCDQSPVSRYQYSNESVSGNNVRQVALCLCLCVCALPLAFFCSCPPSHHLPHFHILSAHPGPPPYSSLSPALSLFSLALSQSAFRSVVPMLGFVSGHFPDNPSLESAKNE